MPEIPQPVLVVARDVLKNKYSQGDLVGLYTAVGIENVNEVAPNKRAFSMQCLGWLNRNRPNDALAIFGRLISEFMARRSRMSTY